MAKPTHRTARKENPGDGGRGAVRRLAKGDQNPADRIADLEGTLIRIAALAYSYNAETPDKRFVELAEAARVAAGEARY